MLIFIFIVKHLGGKGLLPPISWASLLVINRNQWRGKPLLSTLIKDQCGTCPLFQSLQAYIRRGSHSNRNFTPYWQCDFCQLLLHHPLPEAHPFFQTLGYSCWLLFYSFKVVLPYRFSKEKPGSGGQWLVRDVFLRCGFVSKPVGFAGRGSCWVLLMWPYGLKISLGSVLL